MLVLVRLLSIGLVEGVHPVRGRVAWQAWTTERLLDSARTFLFPLYSSLFTPVWLRMLGAEVGRDVEASTVLLIPSLTTIDDGAFLADDTMVATYELKGGWMRLGQARIGKRAFLGNSGMAGAGPPGAARRTRRRAVRRTREVESRGRPGSARPRCGSAVWSTTPTSSAPTDRGASLRVARALWELCRIIPVFVTCAIGARRAAHPGLVDRDVGPRRRDPRSGIVLLAAGAVAATITTIAKWLFVGPIRAGEHPLWSSFVWRTEVSDTFTEMVAAPWFANAAAGTPALAMWLRSLGAKVGRGVWTDSYWLPEPDLVTLGDGATVNRGCVVQTHLFHDRVMSIDTVTIEAGATLGPHSVILPAAKIGANATVGPASWSCAARPCRSAARWSGNPIGPWRAVKVRAYQSADA